VDYDVHATAGRYGRRSQVGGGIERGRNLAVHVHVVSALDVAALNVTARKVVLRLGVITDPEQRVAQEPQVMRAGVGVVGMAALRHLQAAAEERIVAMHVQVVKAAARVHADR